MKQPFLAKNKSSSPRSVEINELRPIIGSNPRSELPLFSAVHRYHTKILRTEMYAERTIVQDETC